MPLGCGALPDVGPYKEASVALQSAMAESGRQAVVRMRALEGSPAFKNHATYPQLVTDLDEAWKARLRAAKAVVTYAEALEAVTDAGHSGDKAVQAVADGVTGLAEAADIAVPAVGSVGAVAVDAAKFIYAQIALARASDTLAEALNRAHPAVERIAEVLSKDIDDLGKVMKAVGVAERNTLRGQYQTELGFRLSLIERRNALYQRSGTLDAQAQGKLAALERERAGLEEKDAPTPADRDRLVEVDGEIAEIYESAEALSPSESSKLLQIEQQLVAMEVWHGPLKKQLDAIDARRLAERELIAVARQAITDWSERHAALQQAVAEERKQPVRADAVMDAANQIKALVDMMRDP